MCYPCRQCGKCRTNKNPIPLTCPFCKTILTETNPICEVCGWSLPPAPGESKAGSLRKIHQQ